MFLMKEYLGEEGPIRLKQATCMFGYGILLIMVWLMSDDIKQKITITIFFIITVLMFAWIGFFSYDTKTEKLNIMMDTKYGNHLVSHVLKRIGKREFDELAYESYEANMHCYECLLVKTPHMYHCKKCDSCIDHQHKHSEFLGKCIGKDNAIAYFWFLLINTILNALFASCLVSCINMPTDTTESDVVQAPSNFVLSLVGCFVAVFENGRVILGGSLLLTVHYMLINFEKLV